jgi:hypothetical protein
VKDKDNLEDDISEYIIQQLDKYLNNTNIMKANYGIYCKEFIEL